MPLLKPHSPRLRARGKNACELTLSLGRSNWLFAGSLRAGKRAAVIMSLIQSAKLNGHDPYRYLADVMERLPTQPASQLDELLPHHWQPRSCPPGDVSGSEIHHTVKV